MREAILARLREEKIVAIARGIAPGSIRALAEALLSGGVTLIEAALDQAGGLETSLKCVRQLAATPGVIAGAGTVMNPEQVEMAREAGATFIVSPNSDARVIKRTRELGLVSLPGAMTPSEIAMAYESGADMVKLFPAGTLGPAYLKAVRAPLSHIPLLAVGGVDETNAAAFLAAGAAGLGIGSLANKALVNSGKFDELAALARRLSEIVKR